MGAVACPLPGPACGGLGRPRAASCRHAACRWRRCVAVAGGTAATVAAGEVLGGDEKRADGGDAKAVATAKASAEPTRPAPKPERKRPRRKPETPAPAPSAPAVTEAAVSEPAVSTSPAPAEPTAATAASTTARRPRGGGVAALQRALGVSVDGDFGPGTEKALKRWQREHGLVADGVAGPATRAALDLGAGRVMKAERRFSPPRRTSARKATLQAPEAPGPRRRRVRAAAGARDRRGRRVRPRHRARPQALAARPRPDRGRHRRPADPRGPRAGRGARC